MKVKKKFFVAFASGVSGLILSMSASAGLVGSVFHNYGQGNYNPGGNDALTANSVIVSDQSSSRFYDSFDFSGIAAGTSQVTELRLTLDFYGAGPRCLGWCELWTARLQGSDSGAQSDDLFSILNDDNSPLTIYLDATSDVGTIDVFGHSVATGSLDLWFSEFSSNLSFDPDEFTLKWGRLDVYNEPTASVPAPAPMALFGIGLAGIGFARRRRKATSS